VAILTILEAPHPVLSGRARPVTEDEFGPTLQAFLSDMSQTMYAAPGVGLAAPQVGDSRRILVANLGGDEDAESRDRLVQMVNPEILERSDESITWEESCLSVPEYDLDVVRSRRIKVRWQDGAGTQQEDWFEVFPAVVLQHEIDHLDGVTLLDHSSRLKRGRYLSRQKKRRALGL
jgi:peptide deformylase